MTKISNAFSKVQLKTSRLILRPLQLSDYELWAKARRERVTKLNEFDQGPLAESKIQKKQFAVWLKKSKEAQDQDLIYSLGIFHRTSEENLGMLSFGVISRMRYQFANLGYELNNQFFGKGYAKEALQAALPVAFKVLKLHRLEAGIPFKNKASIELARRVGMHYEGPRKKYYFDGKDWRDLEYFFLTAEDFGIKKMKPSVSPEWEV